MRINYKEEIEEDISQLKSIERKHRGRPTGDRVKMLRLLKRGIVRSRRELVPILGYSERQLQRWWTTYRKGGLQALLDYRRYPGMQDRLPSEVRQALESEIAIGRITTLKEAQDYLKQNWEIFYSISGLSRLLKRHQMR